MQKSGQRCLVYPDNLVFQFDDDDRLHSIRFVGPLDSLQGIPTWPKLMMLKVDETKYAFVRMTANEAD